MRFRNVLLWVYIGVAVSYAGDVNNFSVVIVPEYSYHGVIVEYSGQVDQANLPHRIGFLVPVNTDSVVSMEQKNGLKPKIVRLETVDVQGEKWIYMDLTQPRFRAKVFFTPKWGEVGKREIDYTIKVNQEITDGHLLVQKPFHAQKFELSEINAETFNDQHGLEFYRVHLEKLPADFPKRVTIRYENPTGLTTIQALQSMLREGGTISPNTQSKPSQREIPKRHRLPKWEPLLVLAILSVAIAIIYLRNRKVEIALPDKSYCSSCGVKLRTGDKFCHKCGRKL